MCICTSTICYSGYLYGVFALATEVRCQEKTRGGLRYEVILGEPEVKTTPPPKKQLSPKSSMSVQDIEDKLKAAEERRQVRNL